RRPQEDLVARRFAQRAVDAEHGDLDHVARLGLLGQQDAVLRVEAADGAAAALAEGQVDLAVDPDFAVVVHRGAEPDDGVGDGLAVDLFGKGDPDAVPAPAVAAGAAGVLERLGLEHLPFRIVKGAMGLGLDLVLPGPGAGGHLVVAPRALDGL